MRAWLVVAIGAFGALGVWMFGRRRRTVTTTSAAAPQTEVYEERRYTEPPL